MVAKEKKRVHFESVSVLSIYRHKNIVISKKKVFTLKLFLISKGEGHGTMGPPKYTTVSRAEQQTSKNISGTKA